MLKVVNFESDKKGYYVLIGLNVVIQSGVIIYGSFSDNVAIVFVIFACNIYALAKRKSVKRFMTEWYVYIILCEVVGILEAIGLIHIKSGVCSVLVEGMIVDIVFIVTSVFMVIMSNRRTEKYASLINIIFFGDWFNVCFSRDDAFRDTEDKLQILSYHSRNKKGKLYLIIYSFPFFLLNLFYSCPKRFACSAINSTSSK